MSMVEGRGSTAAAVSSQLRSSLLHFSTRAQQSETFLNGTSSLYAEQMYEMYRQDPTSVHESWRKFFENDEKGVTFDINDYNQPTAIPGKRSVAVASVRLL
jgi:2-oxoglutarate dehydrogenase E1 component